jgi:hypothetical protein
MPNDCTRCETDSNTIPHICLDELAILTCQEGTPYANND